MLSASFPDLLGAVALPKFLLMLLDNNASSMWFFALVRRYTARPFAYCIQPAHSHLDAKAVLKHSSPFYTQDITSMVYSRL